jgi:hypothetical protein
VVTSRIVAALARMLPAGLRDRQREEWLGDLAHLDGRSRWRYLLTVAMTVPSFHLVARRSNPWPYGRLAVTLPRRGRGYALVAAFTIITAMFGAAVAGRLTWDPPPPLLSADASQALKDTVFPGRVVTGGPDAPAFGQVGQGEWAPGGAVFEVPSVPADRDLKADAVTARDRLAATGWTIDEDVHSDLTADVAWTFTAHSGVRVLEFGAWRYPDHTTSQYVVRRTTYPRAPMLPLLAAAMVAGAAGWIAACSSYRRGRSVVRGSVPLVATFAVLPSVFLLVAREFAAPLGDEGWTPWWYLLFVTGGERPYMYAALTATLAIWLALLPTLHAPIKAPHWEYAD